MHPHEVFYRRGKLSHTIKKLHLQLETKFIRGSTLVRTFQSSLKICNVDDTYPAKLVCLYSSPNQLPNALQKISCKRCFQPVTSSLCYIPFSYFFVLCLYIFSTLNVHKYSVILHFHLFFEIHNLILE